MATVSNSLMKSGGGKPAFSSVINSDGIKATLEKSFGDARAVARITSTLITAVNSSPALQLCNPHEIIAQALRGEGEGLVYGSGYYLTAFKGHVAFMLGYKGLLQKCIATGQYADIDVIDVVEGEYKGKSPKNRRPIIDFSTYPDDKDRASHRVVGYYAYYELKNGFSRSCYVTVDELIDHAVKYVPYFTREKYESILSGALSKEEEEKLRKNTWYDVGGSQIKMMKKTVLKRLLNDGIAPMSNEVRWTLNDDGDEFADDRADGLPDRNVNVSVNVSKQKAAVEQKAAVDPAPPLPPSSSDEIEGFFED